MKVTPGYKQSEVGVIPEEWEVKPLAANVQQHNSGIYKKSAQYGKGFNIVGVSDIYDIDCVDGQRFAEVPLTEKEQAKYLLKENDLLYGESSLVREGIARTVYVTDRGAGTAFAWHTRRYSVKQDALSSAYVYYYLQSRVARMHMMNQCIQTALTGINTVAYFACPLLVPALPEQRAIADALNDVDGLLGGLDRLIAKKRDLKQAVMQQLLTGQTRLPGFHGEWEVKTFGDLFNFSGGYSASRDQLSTEGYCYLHYGDIHGATKTTVDVRAEYQNIPKLNIPLKRVASKSLLEDGDVVFVDASEDDEGASRHVVVVNKDKRPFISGLHTIVAKSKTDELAHEYRQYCFQTAAIRQQFLFYAVGTKVSGISKTNIAKLKMPIPKVTEQTAIAEVLTEMDAELTALEQHREKTRALKQAMMQELLTGKTRLVPPEEADA